MPMHGLILCSLFLDCLFLWIGILIPSVKYTLWDQLTYWLTTPSLLQLFDNDWAEVCISDFSWLRHWWMDMLWQHPLIAFTSEWWGNGQIFSWRLPHLRRLNGYIWSCWWLCLNFELWSVIRSWVSLPNYQLEATIYYAHGPFWPPAWAIRVGSADVKLNWRLSAKAIIDISYWFIYDHWYCYHFLLLPNYFFLRKSHPPPNVPAKTPRATWWSILLLLILTWEGMRNCLQCDIHQASYTICTNILERAY